MKGLLLKVIYPLAVAAIALVMSACAPLRTPTSPAAPIESRHPGLESTEVRREVLMPQTIVPDRRVVRPAQKAVNSLLQKGWGHYRLADYKSSIATAERAQRLDPQRAEVYLLLASCYFVQGQGELAEQMAQRGLSFSQDDKGARRQLHSLLGRVRDKAY